MKQAVLVLALCLGAVGASAAGGTAVYRCGNSYSQVPCPAGKTVDADDPRSSAQRLEAERLALQERQRATQMEQARLRHDGVSRPALASGFDSRATPAAPAALAAQKAKPKKRHKLLKLRRTDKDFVAVEPRARNPKQQPAIDPPGIVKR